MPEDDATDLVAATYSPSLLKKTELPVVVYCAVQSTLQWRRRECKRWRHLLAVLLVEAAWVYASLPAELLSSTKRHIQIHVKPKPQRRRIIAQLPTWLRERCGKDPA
ncbi:hypothetical protein GN244_ATG13961 [Phytophthora infestans]|uniref:Uncharacterized protein n=1 Tax=Phytophthora infestans TaxID=4787 RepID=A0A833SNL4_PHYIN|nr:hypothetical protein GN244_ATG13961 [Phytophthora infestans]KAF4143869.1 hypothetical protein GN958_ATG06955 [Phytophthora infestans]